MLSTQSLLVTIFFLFSDFSTCQAAFQDVTAGSQWQTSLPIVYRVDPNLSSLAKNAIISAVQHIRDMVPGLDLLEDGTTLATPTLAFLLENSRGFCEDKDVHIGKHSSGITNIFITETSNITCGTRGWILHMMMHAFGFFHEHQRQDRDYYVYVNYANTRLGWAAKRALLDIIESTGVKHIGIYDWESVTHYHHSATAYTGKTTIVSMPPDYYSLKSFGHATNPQFTDESVLSIGDIVALRAMFPGPQTALPSGSCLNGGVWFNWCLCRPGHYGRYCNQVYCNNECLNGGTCQIMASGLPGCLCPAGYSGNYCEIDSEDDLNCACPWWSLCNTGYSACSCDPYPYGDVNCSSVVSNMIPTTIPPSTTSSTTTLSTKQTTVSSSRPPTRAPLSSCQVATVPGPRSMAFQTSNYVYLRLGLTDIAFQANYTMLDSYESLLLAKLITEGMGVGFNRKTKHSFLSIILVKIHRNNHCSVVDFLAKFSAPLTMQMIADVAHTASTATTIYGVTINLSSRVSGARYVSSINTLVDPASKCAVFEAEGACKNGGRCAMSGTEARCTCPPGSKYAGAFCDEPVVEEKSSANQNNDKWPSVNVVLVALASAIVFILIVILLAIFTKYTRNNWANQREGIPTYHPGHLPAWPSRFPNYLLAPGTQRTIQQPLAFQGPHYTGKMSAIRRSQATSFVDTFRSDDKRNLPSY